MKKFLLTLISLSAFTLSAAVAADSEIDAKEKSRRAAIEKIPACVNVLNECKKLGFVAGEHKTGNGLWRDCFHQTLAGKAVSAKGKEVSVAASASDVSSCKAEAKDSLKGALVAKGKEGKKSKE